MSKIFRIGVASAVVAGVAALTPLSAQAKSVTELGAYTADSCTGAASISGLVSGTSFTLNLPASAGTLDVVARVYTLDRTGKQIFTARKTVMEGVSGTVRGSVLSGQHIWRIDASDPATDALVYTSDGVLGCD